MSRRKLRLVLHLGPLGFDQAEIWLTDRKPVGYSVTRGEGQCLTFALEDYDCSTEFHKAMQDGRLLRHYGGKGIALVWPKERP